MNQYRSKFQFLIVGGLLQLSNIAWAAPVL